MIYLENIQDKIFVEESLVSRIEKSIDLALKEEMVYVDYEVSVLLVDNEKIREINKEHRNIDRETDVLSFPMLDYPKGKVYKDIYVNFDFDKIFLDEDKLLLGDIVISLEKAKEQSIDYGHSFEREVLYLITHSVLHLLGYDHMEEEEKRFMREREEAILDILDVKR